VHRNLEDVPLPGKDREALMELLRWGILTFGLLPTIAVAALTGEDRKAQFEKEMAARMATATPNQSAHQRQTLIKQYVEAKPNKAQAVQLENGVYWRSSEHEEASAAGDRALEGCQLHWAGTPCALIAVNDELAEGEPVAKDMPRLNYVGPYDTSQIPIIRLATRQRPDVQNYDKAMQPKAMAIHPWGKVFISAGDAGQKEAQASALANCNSDPARNGRDDVCYVYAVNNNVVISERRTEAK
jgi:hypothetical protein